MQSERAHGPGVDPLGHQRGGQRPEFSFAQVAYLAVLFLTPVILILIRLSLTSAASEKVMFPGSI